MRTGSAWRIRRRAALACVALTVVAACGQDGGGAATPPATPWATSPGATAKIHGVAETVDDVGEPDRAPMTGGTLLVLPRAAATDLWQALDFTPDEAAMPYVGGVIASPGLEGAMHVMIADGRFAFDPADGEYLVCHLLGQGPERMLRGCAEATVNGPASWSVSSSEGGFELSTGG